METGAVLNAIDRRIRVVESVKDWVEATRQSGSLLLTHGCVEEPYIEKMVETCRELGPYIAIMPGLAIPHARPEDGARKLCLSVVVVRKGVNFGSHNDPVYVLIAFSTPDKSSHIEVMKQLANVLLDKGEALIKELKEALDEEDALRRLTTILGVGASQLPSK